MAQPLPASHFESHEEYLKAFWIMSEFGVSEEDYEYFEFFFGYGQCPQTDAEAAHRASLPETGVRVYRGYCGEKGHWGGFSWTPDRELAEWFARRHPNTTPMLAEFEVDPEDIDAILLDRETEYVITDLPDSSEIIFTQL